MDIDKAKATFARFDINGDGFISPEEYSKVMAEMGDPYVSVPVAQAVIAKADTSKDGLLNWAEFWAIQQA
ncbi:EF-hand domain-containing protein [Kitasatospora sp. NPDC085879]|uniref:EF-hand domain-containing protein n=1 Tax=Kitasatospora sp. NPDC085879 TaxID=3154769 RepID=UPI000BB14EB3|nr:EF-hand domain-containing protein [Streptomyces sp. TLI_235]PBC76837.1 EF hand domain-containing protein [Streptomyces sp. TLI_235]